MAARVLICEPNDDVRELLVTAVRRLGYEPQVGHADAEGAAPEADVVVLEPGSECCREELRRLLEEGSALPPIVALSIYAPEEQPNGFPIAAHVAKPFTLQQLRVALARALAAA